MRLILQDGPAVGEPLHIERTPIFLRVAQNGLAFRALDQESDDPELTEIVHVYLRTGPRGTATYRHHHSAPVRDSYLMTYWSWRAWVTSQPDARAFVPSLP